jgi:pilus assembly protein CpaE
MTTLTRPATMAALLRTPETRDAVAAALAGVGSVALKAHLGELDAVPPDLLLHERPDLVLVDVDLASASHRGALEDLAARCGEGVPVMVTAASATVEGMRLLLRLDTADLMPQPIDAVLLREALAALVRTARRPTAPPGERGTVVAFLKAGGGVGATSLAVHAACSLAGDGAGRGTGEAEVCLLDFDLQFGAAAMHLDVEHAASLIELPDMSRRFDGTLLRSAMAHHRSGIDLLPAPRSLHPLDVVAPETAVTLVRAAAADYRRVVVDLPPSWTAWTRAALAEADAIVLVLRPDVPSIRQARRQIETLAAEGCGDIPLVTVANFAPTTLFGRGVDLKDAARSLGRAIDHAIPRADRAFGDAANLGLPLTEVKGGRRAARRVAEMMRAVLTAART